MKRSVGLLSASPSGDTYYFLSKLLSKGSNLIDLLIWIRRLRNWGSPKKDTTWEKKKIFLSILPVQNYSNGEKNKEAY